MDFVAFLLVLVLTFAVAVASAKQVLGIFLRFMQ